MHATCLMTTMDRTITQADLASTLYPSVAKPPWVATSVLLQWCELAAMEGLGGCVVGVEASIRHRKHAELGETLTVTANRCTTTGDRSHWYATVHRVYELIASADLVFVTLDPLRLAAAAGELRAGAGVGRGVGHDYSGEHARQYQHSRGDRPHDLVGHPGSVVDQGGWRHR